MIVWWLLILSFMQVTRSLATLHWIGSSGSWNSQESSAYQKVYCQYQSRLAKENNQQRSPYKPDIYKFFVACLNATKTRLVTPWILLRIVDPALKMTWKAMRLFCNGIIIAIKNKRIKSIEWNKPHDVNVAHRKMFPAPWNLVCCLISVKGSRSR